MGTTTTTNYTEWVAVFEAQEVTPAWDEVYEDARAEQEVERAAELFFAFPASHGPLSARLRAYDDERREWEGGLR
jgi:hypothetical protein